MITSTLLPLATLHTWITPLWLLSVGVALGAAALAIAFGLLWLVSRGAASFAYHRVREGMLLPIFYLVAVLSVFAVLGTVVVPGLPWRAVLGSIARINSVGTRDFAVTIPASTTDFEVKEMAVPTEELQAFELKSELPLTISSNLTSHVGQNLGVKLTPGAGAQWQKPIVPDRDRIKVQPVTQFLVTNTSAKPAQLQVHMQTDIEYPQVRVVPWVALSLVALVLLYLVGNLLSPKLAAIALTTCREAMYQPLFYLALGLGSLGLLAFIYIPYNTFGDDIKMLKDSGLVWIMVWAIFVAVWSASASVSEEVEGRTALTVLSKPVQRWQFIVGKFLGVLGPVVVLFIVLGFFFLITVSYKVVYDARETAKSEPMWQVCYLEMIRILPGLVLAFFETVVLAAISVALSTRLPTLANLIVCSTVYVLGHLVPMLVNSSVGKFEIVRFVGQFIATVLPVLDHFNIQAAVAAGQAVPLDYLGMAFLYCLLYSTIAMLVGLAMFEDRDLA